MTHLAIVLLVNRQGELLLQLRDENAPIAPNKWGLPGGHIEPGESPIEAAERELFEESGLRAASPLVLFERHEWEVPSVVLYYFSALTWAVQDDVVLGEGAAMVFVPAAKVLDGREFSRGTEDVVDRFLRSPRYLELSTMESQV